MRRSSSRGCFAIPPLLAAVLAAGCAVTPAERAELLETYWRLTAIDGSPVAVHPGTREPHIVFRREGNRLAGHTGCNSVAGSYDLRGAAGSLRFGPLAMTRMACLSAGSGAAEAAFGRALEAASSYRIAGRTLELLDAGSTVRLRFEERPRQ